MCNNLQQQSIITTMTSRHNTGIN